MAQTALQAMKQQRRQIAREARRIRATKLFAEQQRPWWVPLRPPAELEARQVSNVDCHRVLGAPRGASTDQLKEAFLARAKERNASDLDGESNFVVARMCYEYLASPHKAEESLQSPLATVSETIDVPAELQRQNHALFQQTSRFFSTFMFKVASPNHAERLSKCPTVMLSMA